MRQIGSLADAQQAQCIADYLMTQGIVGQIDADGSDWAVWVRDENQVELAKNLFQQFQQDPDQAKYRNASVEAEKLREAEIRRRAQVAKNTIQMGQTWNQPLRRRAPLAFSLIGLSIFASLVTDFGGYRSGSVFNALMFCDIRIFAVTGDGWMQIRQGQLWRLVTPIFLHGHWLHLLFNMGWMYYLGAMVESRCGTARMGWMVAVMAVVSNIAQFLIGGSPMFLGMSGVVYGLFGYAWLRQRTDPQAGFYISETTVFLMLLFLVMGFAGGFRGAFGGNTANWAHLGGLAAGLALAAIKDVSGNRPRSASR